jgi:exonuclease VII large subunit
MQHSQLPLRVAEAVAAARADARNELDRLEQRLEQREGELAALRRQWDQAQGALAEAASTTTAQAQEQVDQLIAEREAWIEEMQSQRAEATGALGRSLSRRATRSVTADSSILGALPCRPVAAVLKRSPPCILPACSRCSRCGVFTCAGASLC